MANFELSRENSAGDLIEWARNHMTRPLRVLEEHAEEIGQVGVDVVQGQIVALDRIADPHEERDGPESMLEGVQAKVTGSTQENKVNIKVGWDLTQYRHGYPQLQDQGTSQIEGMQALSLAEMAMREAVVRTLNEGTS
jgi:hypothetical protein